MNIEQSLELFANLPHKMYVANEVLCACINVPLGNLVEEVFQFSFHCKFGTGGGTEKRTIHIFRKEDMQNRRTQKKMHTH